MSTEEHLQGWMALLETDGNACQDLQQARTAATALGWALEEEEAVDAEEGLWMVTLSQEDFQELARQGCITTVTNDGGHSYRGQVDTP